MDNQGWIKVYRKMLDNPISKKPLYCHLWTHCLLLAQHEATSFIWNNEKIVLNPGQFVTGRKKLSEQTGISESSIERILKFFESEHQITQQKTTKFRIITIVNWGEHQQKNNKRTASDTTSGQQKDTYKKDKNVKNEKEQEQFEISRRLYPGRKRGLVAEFEYFCKTVPDWRDILPLIEPAIRKQIKWRQNPNNWMPRWKDFKSWIYNKYWTLEPPKPLTPQPRINSSGR